jgi:hypothetical protein
MMQFATAILVVCLIASSALAQLDVAALAEAYKQADAAFRDGLGHSTSPDSGTLGWSEGPTLQNYASLWEVTGDPYWLDKIRQHFHHIMATATDPDGDGYLSWHTPTYSTAVAFAERLHNVGTADIAPDRQKQTSSKLASQATGHTCLIEFQDSATTYRVRDLDTNELLVEAAPYESGAKITAIVPFTFTITGQTHQGDRFIIRTHKPIPATFAVHQGMFVYPAALFIEAVKNDPQLQAEFGDDADTFLAFINKHIFEKNEVDWLDMGELGGGYRFEPFITDRYPNRIMPHNQFGALCRAWLVLKDVQGADPRMANRAEQMVRYFYNHLHLMRSEDADDPFEWYQWYYWDWTDYGEPGHSGWEDTSHAGLTMSMAVEAARRGVIFTDADMQRIANCWLRVMYNGDEQNPKMAARVDGEGEHKFSALHGSWSRLSQWDRRAYDLALGAFESMSEAVQVRNAPTMLLVAKRAGMLPR